MNTAKKTTKKTPAKKTTAKTTKKVAGKKHISTIVWGRIMAKAWRDAKFKELIEQDPTGAVHKYLKEELGENPSDYLVFKLPDQPGDLTDEQLKNVESGSQPMAGCTHLC